MDKEEALEEEVERLQSDIEKRNEDVMQLQVAQHPNRDGGRRPPPLTLMAVSSWWGWQVQLMNKEEEWEERIEAQVV